MPKFNDVLNKKAVALSYDENKNAAPIIVASGMGYLAERMVEVAQEAGVPVYEDNSLATMLTQLDLGSEIPVELYQAIIDIYIYFLGYVPGKKKDVEQTEGEAVSEEGREGGEEAPVREGHAEEAGAEGQE
jgi:flagellar biosynthesis protein